MENVKTVVKFATALSNSVDKALADHKVDFMDIPLIMSPLMQIGKAVQAFGTAKTEWRNADAAQKKEIIETLKTDLDLRSDKTEEVIEKSLDLVVHINDLVKLVKGSKKA